MIRADLVCFELVLYAAMDLSSTANNECEAYSCHSTAIITGKTSEFIIHLTMYNLLYNLFSKIDLM